MSFQESFPAPPPEPTPAARAVPPSVKLATTLILVGLALSVVSLLVGLIFIDDAVDSTLESDTSGLNRDDVKTAAIIFAIIFFAIGAAIQLFFYFFLRKGANWARITYVVLSGIFLLFGLIGLFGQPILPLLVSLIGYAITIAIIVLLFRPDANAFYSGKGQGPRPGEPGYGQNQY